MQPMKTLDYLDALAEFELSGIPDPPVVVTEEKETAPVLIIETPLDFYTVHLARPMTMEEIYEYLFVRFGRRCRIALQEGVARAIF